MQLTNTASSLGFEVIHRGPVPTEGQIAFALCSRLIDLFGEDRSELWNAAWDPFDTYTEDAEAFFENGIDSTPTLTEWEIGTLRRMLSQILDRKRGEAA